MKKDGKIKSILTKAKQDKVVLLILLVYNFVWSSLKIAFGIFSQAFYFCISGVSTIMFGFTKRLYIKNYKSNDFEEKRKKAVSISILIMISGLCFTFYMARLFFISSSFNYGLILSITIATFSFCELGFSIYNFLKAKKSNDFLLQSLRGCSLASSFYAIVLTQSALLSATGTNGNIGNAITGVIMGANVMIIGLFLLIKNLKVRKENMEKK